MRYKHREHTIQLSLIVFCCMFVAVTRTELPVSSQSCIVPYLAAPPEIVMVQKPASCSEDR
jgi:hypothetical protein